MLPASTAAADSASASPMSSTLTRTFASRARSAAARRFCGTTSWFAIRTSSAPARTMTIASQIVAAQIPNAPCSSCRRAMCGLLWFLTWPRRRAWSSGRRDSMYARFASSTSRSMTRAGRHDVVLAPPDRRPVLVTDTVVGFGDDRGRVSHAIAPHSPRSSMSRSQRDSGPRGRTGQMSTTRPSSMTWYASK